MLRVDQCVSSLGCLKSRTMFFAEARPQPDARPSHLWLNSSGKQEGATRILSSNCTCWSTIAMDCSSLRRLAIPIGLGRCL